MVDGHPKNKTVEGFFYDSFESGPVRRLRADFNVS
jgi:hypothetical protein